MIVNVYAEPVLAVASTIVYCVRRCGLVFDNMRSLENFIDFDVNVSEYDTDSA